MTLFLCLALMAALVAWMSAKLRELERRNAEQDRRIEALIERIYAMESGVKAAPAPIAASTAAEIRPRPRVHNRRQLAEQARCPDAAHRHSRCWAPASDYNNANFA